MSQKISDLTSDRSTQLAFTLLEQDAERIGLEQARAGLGEDVDLTSALAEAWTAIYLPRAREVLEPDPTGRGHYPRAGYGLGGAELEQALELLEQARFQARAEEVRRLEASGEALAPALFRSASDLFGSSEDETVLLEEASEYSALTWGRWDKGPRAPTVQALAEALARGEALAYLPGVASGSDYSGGGALGRSNCRALEELAEASDGLARTWSISGGHGTYGLAVDYLARSSDLTEALKGLGDYPVVDEELMCELEREEEQAFLTECGGLSDFERALEAVLSDRYGIDVDGALDHVKPEALEALFWSLEPSFEHSAEGAYVDVKELAEQAETSEIEALEGFMVPTEALEEVRRSASVVQAVRGVPLPTGPDLGTMKPEELLGIAGPILEAEQALRSAVRGPEDLLEGQGRRALERMFQQLADPRLADLLASRRGHYLEVLATWWADLTGEDLTSAEGSSARPDLARALKPEAKPEASA